MTRCATPSIDVVCATYKREDSPYDNPAYDVPTCQRGKILPASEKKQPRCATPNMDKILELEIEYERGSGSGSGSRDS